MSTKTSTTAAPQAFSHANAMPAPTWHRLHISDTELVLPELACVSECHVNSTVPIASSTTPVTNAAVPKDTTPEGFYTFDQAMTQAQQAWEQTHPQPFITTALLDAQKPDDATYGGTALSRYQQQADVTEAARSLSAAFKTGLGSSVFSFLRANAAKVFTLHVPPGQTAQADITLFGQNGALNICALDVVAEEGANVTVNLVVDSPEAGTGFTATSLRVFADAHTNVTINRVQSLDASWTDIDDTGLFTWNNAQIAVNHSVFGAGKTFTGLAGDVRGDESRINVATHYLGHANQVHDFNYELRLHGLRTLCNLDATGVLSGSAKKTLRGTIDLVRGCKGASGQETETVLLVDEGIENKTIPVILCNEDDVAGNHGATIGHVRPEQMFYLSCRGLSEKEAESMFVRALLEQAVINAPNHDARTGLIRLGETFLPQFKALFDEEGE